jgi:hypothetical protein
MTIQQTILDQMGNAFFPVAEQEVFVGGRISTGHKGIVRVDTGEVLAIHGEGYKLTPNEAIMTQFVDALSSSGLTLDGAMVQSKVSHEGARMFSKIILPAHKVEIAPGDCVDLQISVVNSYDGWTALRSIFGGFRILCSNGLVVGTKMWEGYGRHTQNLDISATARRLQNVAQSYENVSDVWSKWANSTILEGQWEQVVDVVAPTEKAKETLLNQFVAEKVELGSTVWAAYNALTHWSTHTTSNRKDASMTEAAAQFQREEHVRKGLPMLYQIAS